MEGTKLPSTYLLTDSVSISLATHHHATRSRNGNKPLRLALDLCTSQISHEHKFAWVRFGWRTLTRLRLKWKLARTVLSPNCAIVVDIIPKAHVTHATKSSNFVATLHDKVDSMTWQVAQLLTSSATNFLDGNRFDSSSISRSVAVS